MFFVPVSNKVGFSVIKDGNIKKVEFVIFFGFHGELYVII